MNIDEIIRKASSASRVYLDYAATCPLLPEVKAEMLRVMEGDYGNASALHTPGQAAESLIAVARTEVARLLGAKTEEIIFTAGGTEANNLVMATFRAGDVVISAVEHPSVREAARATARRVREIAVDQWGRVSLADLEKILSSETRPDLVSVMLANNELGTLEPVKEVVKCCKNYNIPVHCDATQAFGKIKINVDDLGVDYLTVSAHKIGGPQGAGALYVRKGAKLKPLLYGGKQESGRRAGTSNLLAIAGFGGAAKWCWENWSCKKWADVARLRDSLRQRILEAVPHSSCNSPEGDCLPNILNVSFRAAEGESLQLYLDLAGIAVSTGSACASGDLAPSHVLMAARGDAEIAHSSLRFSLGLETTAQDINRVMAVLPGIVEYLQAISTVEIKPETISPRNRPEMPSGRAPAFPVNKIPKENKNVRV